MSQSKLIVMRPKSATEPAKAATKRPVVVMLPRRVEVRWKVAA